MNILPYLMVKYAPRGTPPNTADCWTLARYVLREEFGFTELPDYYYDVDDAGPVAGPLMVRELTDVHGRWGEVSLDFANWIPGDLLIFRHRGDPWHIGVYVGTSNGTAVFLHTIQGRHSCVENVATWQHRLVAVRRWTGK